MATSKPTTPAPAPGEAGTPAPTPAFKPYKVYTKRTQYRLALGPVIFESAPAPESDKDAPHPCGYFTVPSVEADAAFQKVKPHITKWLA